VQAAAVSAAVHHLTCAAVAALQGQIPALSPHKHWHFQRSLRDWQ
jgi:hypothetical protein